MKTPQFAGNGVEIFNEKPLPLHEIRQADRRALLGLRSAQALLGLGVVLILLNNLDVLASGSYFGAFNWLTVAVFSIGLAISFVAIPYLYFSSYRNFKKEDEFWDKETFWILPLFFFGTFFIYASQIDFAPVIFLVSVAATLVVHLGFVRKALRSAAAAMGGDLSSDGRQYGVTLKYLTAYYMLVIALLVSYNPLQQALIWVRLNS